MGPCLDRHGKRPACGADQYEDELQWGRALIGTESAAPARRARVMIELQWGRALIGTESIHKVARPTPDVQLQWGRALIGTESWSLRTTPSKTSRFNGAVP